MEYGRLIERIVEAEQQAQAMVHAEEETLAKLPQALEEENRRVMEDYLARAKRRIDQTEESERVAADGEIAGLKLGLAADLAAVEQRFVQRQESYRRSILAQVLGAGT